MPWDITKLPTTFIIYFWSWKTFLAIMNRSIELKCTFIDPRKLGSSNLMNELSYHIFELIIKWMLNIAFAYTLIKSTEFMMNNHRTWTFYKILISVHSINSKIANIINTNKIFKNNWKLAVNFEKKTQFILILRATNIIWFHQSITIYTNMFKNITCSIFLSQTMRRKWWMVLLKKLS